MERPGGAADGVDEHARVRLRRGPRPAHAHAKERARRGAQRSAAASRPRVHERRFLQLTLPSLPRRSSDRPPRPPRRPRQGGGAGGGAGDAGPAMGRALPRGAGRPRREAPGRRAARAGPVAARRRFTAQSLPMHLARRSARPPPPPPTRPHAPACVRCGAAAVTHARRSALHRIWVFLKTSTVFVACAPNHSSKCIYFTGGRTQMETLHASIPFFFFARAVRSAAPDRGVADRAAPRAGENSFPKHSESGLV